MGLISSESAVKRTSCEGVCACIHTCSTGTISLSYLYTTAALITPVLAIFSQPSSPLTSLTLTCQPTSGSCTRGAEHSTFSLHNSYPLLHGLCFFQRIHHCPPDPLPSPVDSPLFPAFTSQLNALYTVLVHTYVRPYVLGRTLCGKNPSVCT